MMHQPARSQRMAPGPPGLVLQQLESAVKMEVLLQTEKVLSQSLGSRMLGSVMRVVGGGGTDGAGESISSNFLCISSSKARMSRQRTLASLMVSMDNGCREQMQRWVARVGFEGEYEKKSIQSGRQWDKNKLVMGVRLYL